MAAPAPTIKICGLRDAASLEAAVEAGASALGFMAYSRSKRFIEAGALASLLKAVPARGTLKVGVFVNPSLEDLKRYLAVGLDVLQLHGSESEDFALEAAKLAPVWKAFAPRRKADVEKMRDYPAKMILVDAFSQFAYGGTGLKADWDLASLAAKEMPGRVILAGGLSLENVAEAIERIRPAGVDVSSGVESSPGVKSVDLIRSFVKAAQSAFARL